MRTCALRGGRFPPADTDRHTRVGAHRRRASVNGVRMFLYACVRFVTVIHNVSSKRYSLLHGDIAHKFNPSQL